MPVGVTMEPQVGVDEVPGPEAPVSPEEPPSSDGSKIHNCALCGSEMPVPEGVSSIECPLCGEINNL